MTLGVEKFIIGAGLLAFALFGAYRHGVTTTAGALNGRHKAELAARDKDNALHLAWLLKQARQQEQAAADRMAAMDQQYSETLKSEIDSRDAVIAGLRSGSLRLRERFTCTDARTAERKATTGPIASVDDGRQTSGLSADDAEFFVREAHRADAIAVELQQCKAIARSDRANQLGEQQ